MQPKQQEYRTRINQYIRVPRVKLIGADGAFLGEMATYEAQKLAKEAGLDLVEINGKTSPPMVKIMDFGRFKFLEKKKAAEAKRKQFIPENKELALHPNTELHDVNRLCNQAKEFLIAGHRVKMLIKFRGRELSHMEVGEDKLNYIMDTLSDYISD